MSIEWDKFDRAGKYVKFVAGKPKQLKLTAVRDEIQSIDNKQLLTLVFGVSEEDGTPCTKEWSITSLRLAHALKEIGQKVETGQAVVVKVTQFGTGYQTYYELNEIINGITAKLISTEVKK